MASVAHLRRQTIPVHGMDCEDCARSVAATLRALPGVLEAEVSAAAGSARIAWDGDRVGLPAIAAAIEAHGYRVAIDDGTGPLRFDLVGMDCADCARSVEKAVALLPGVASARVDFGTATLTVTAGADASPALAGAIGGAVARAGYSARERLGGGDHQLPARFWQDRRFVAVVAGLLCWVAGMALTATGGPALASTALYIVALALGITRFGRAALLSLRARRIDMNVLMTISALGAAALGDWSEAAFVVVLFALGGTLQAVTLDRTRSAVRALMALTPREAILVADGAERVVPAAQVRTDDLVRVKPGAYVPADGVIVDGHSALDQAAITGESMPVDRGPGGAVFGGSVNGGGSLLVRVTAPVSESTVARIVELVASAQASKAPVEQFVDRFAAWYTPIVVAVAAALAGGGALFAADAGVWIYRALVLLVIACPCALVISTPVSVVAALGAGSRRGILIKGGGALEALGRVRAVALDKTGTLTHGHPRVQTIAPVAGVVAADLLALAAAVEAHSEHPIARAVVARAAADGLVVPAATAFVATPGRGVEATVAGRRIRAGSPAWVLADAAADGDTARLVASGLTPLVVAEIDPAGVARSLGAIGVADTLRAEAAGAVADLRRQGIAAVLLLTGDAEPAARAVAAACGLTAAEVRAGLLPADKGAAVAAIEREYGPVAMVGDGINDAPALAAAAVGIAMGRGGTDVALETAGVALMRDDLRGVGEAIDLGRRTLAIIRQNVGVSFAIKAVALGLGVAGYVDLWIAVAADVGASLLVTANGLRLLRVGKA
jgi:Cd2+/Zn2+-exporting ATPase